MFSTFIQEAFKIPWYEALVCLMHPLAIQIFQIENYCSLDNPYYDGLIALNCY